MKKLFRYIESMPIGPIAWLFSAYCIFTIRMVIEAIGERQGELADYVLVVLHGPLAFLGAGLSTALIIYAFTRTPLKKVLNLTLYGMSLVILVPVIDFIVSGGKGNFHSSYLIERLPILGRDFITFFGPGLRSGVTIGARTQFVLLLLFVGLYVYYATKKVWKSLLAVLVGYCLVFFWTALPSIVTMLILLPQSPLRTTSVEFARALVQVRQVFAIPFTLNDVYKQFDIQIGLVVYLLVVLQGALLLWFGARKKVIQFVKSMRPSRLLMHYALFAVGAVIGLALTRTSWDFSFFGVVVILNLLIVITAIWVANLAINDSNDLIADAIVHKNRPLVAKQLTIAQYQVIFVFAVIVAIAGAGLIGYVPTMLVIVTLICGYIYSAQPFRLKRFPLLATGLMSLGLLFLALLGFYLFSPSQSFFEFPSAFIYLIVLVPTLILPIKDLRDVAGDKKDGVHTLPTIFGESRARIIIAALFAISFFLFPLLLHAPDLIVTATVFALLSILLIMNRRINELYLMGVYGVFLIVVAVTVL